MEKQDSFFCKSGSMSILPVYLCSFLNVAPLQRGVVERLGLNETDKTQKTVRNDEEESKRSRGLLIVRSGDVVSDYGDVFSPSQTERSDQSVQSQQSKGDITKELTAEEQLQVNDLKQQDAEVKAHEAAHLAAAGGLARGGASYEYQKGPDGQNYAVGGEVSIDSSPVDGNPKSTIAKAQQIRSAALAPASPSSQDYQVAAKASQMEAEARQEIAKSDRTSQGEQGSTVANDSENAEEFENVDDNQKSQYFSQTAVTKYVAGSHHPLSRLQTGFQAIA